MLGLGFPQQAYADRWRGREIEGALRYVRRRCRRFSRQQIDGVLRRQFVIVANDLLQLAT